MFRKEIVKQKIRTKRGLYEKERKKKFRRLKNTRQYENYLRQKGERPKYTK